MLTLLFLSAETVQKNKHDEQQGKQPADQTVQQPVRRAIINGKAYELYWVN